MKYEKYNDTWVCIGLVVLFFLFPSLYILIEDSKCPSGYKREWKCLEEVYSLPETCKEFTPQVNCNLNLGEDCIIVIDTQICNDGDRVYFCKCEFKTRCLRGQYECVRND